MSLPTLDDLKAHLDIASGRHDGELLDFLDAAVDVVEGIVGPLSGATVTETHYNAAPVLVLRRRPAIAVVSVSVSWSTWGGSTGYSPSDYVLDGEAGLLRSADGYPFSGDVTVTYTAGRTTVPASIRLAILIIAGHLWETQRGVAPSALALQGEDGGDGGGAAYAPGIPARAKALLERYVSGPQVA